MMAEYEAESSFVPVHPRTLRRRNPDDPAHEKKKKEATLGIQTEVGTSSFADRLKPSHGWLYPVQLVGTFKISGLSPNFSTVSASWNKFLVCTFWDQLTLPHVWLCY